LTTSFSDFHLDEPLLQALAAERYVTPTPIQAQAIPQLMAGRDVLGLAQTGTGKTAAFALPILHRLHKQGGGVGRGPRALVLAPTRELAIQVGESFRSYGRHLKLCSAVIFGGVGQKPQAETIARGLDILVATPGRLLDLCGQGLVPFDRLSVLVLDEADRMLDMGFLPDVRRVVALLPKERQTLLFSATMPDSIARLAASILSEPVRVEAAAPATTVDRIEQRVIFLPSAEKPAVLTDLLRNPAMTRVLVFARTKHGANRIAMRLARANIRTEAIHGNKSQAARQRALEAFRSGHARVLVATNIAARGIDVDGITHVINFDIPSEPESYVHRVGRTARAGASGVAISLCDASERAFLAAIERLTKRGLEVIEYRRASADPARDAKVPPRARRNASRSPWRLGPSPSSRRQHGIRDPSNHSARAGRKGRSW